MAESLADTAVRALAMVQAMDAEITNDDPQRHHVRRMKMLAQQAMETGFHQAISLAWLAKDLKALVDDVREESGPVEAA